MRKLLVAVVLGTLLVAAGYAVTGAWTQKAPPGNCCPLGNTANKAGNSAPCCPQALGNTDVLPAAVTIAKSGEGRAASTQPAQRQDATGALAVMRKAADAKKHLFLFVYEQDNDATRETRKKFDAAIQELGDTVQWAAVNRADSSESDFIQQLELKTAPMPLVLVLAPNGAVTGGFLSAKVTEERLLDAVVSPAEQACLKALQDGKLVLLCAQNSTTKENDAAMKGVDEFKADARYGKFTEVVKLDPVDAVEKKFLAKLQLASTLDQATTVFLAPPGLNIAKFTGATTKEKLAEALQKASASCSGSPGCCPTSK